jgi:hypothetical protein
MRIIAALLLTVFAMPAMAQISPPEGSQPLSQILAGIEAEGARTVSSAEFETRRWEIVSCPGRSRICQEDRIDPATGAVTATDRDSVMFLPPRGSLPASQIAAQVESMALGTITELSFDDRRWEVEVRSGLRSAEFYIDPATGTVQRCEGTLCP